ncbi:MAG: UDP-N-acetylmuramoyl-tripeptide--D-alanyl-D-alanine ligase [Clostridia bacterium]|nr:UDP-N-acetylmuramoyl-tripeptide--D-alanyl-D-alanine ligase [Clostridia bacterium]
MDNVLERIIASVVCATLFCLATYKTLGAMQQSGYKNGSFLRWLKRKDNMLYNRLSVLALCIALSTAVVSLCFSFLGSRLALILSALPFVGLWTAYIGADTKYALKVRTVATGRVKRLFALYFLFTLCFTYLFIALLCFLSVWNGSPLYKLISFVPFALMGILLPFILCLANAVASVFENIRNGKFVKRAGQVLNESEIIRVGVVGSYGKTSVKNILKTLLSEKYSVVETPESYNTPVGIAKTVFSEEFAGKEVFIAEMGARKRGDIKELCDLVKPDYAVFTGVCAQHLASFGAEEEILKEKSEIIASGAKVVCGQTLIGKVSGENVVPVCQTENVSLQDKETSFTLVVKDKRIAVQTKLLGEAAVENIALAATLAYTLGLTAEEIERGVQRLDYIPHRLQLIENGGAYILDDGYNSNPRGAEEAVRALARFSGGKCIVTPGIVECGTLEEEINGKLGGIIAAAGIDKVILVGDTLVGVVKAGYLAAGGDEEKLTVVKTLDEAKTELSAWVQAGDCVLFLNDLPDVY